MFSKDPIGNLNQSINKYKPDVIGFSIRNLDNQYMLNPDNPLPEIKQYISLAKQKNITTVIGGTAVTTLPKQFFTYFNPDYGIAGQGEDSIISLLDLLANNPKPSTDSQKKNIPGLIFKNDQEIVVNPPSFSGYRGRKADFSFIDFSKQKNTFWPAGIITKSGCPFRCSYCNAGYIAGNKYIIRDKEEIIEDIRHIKTLYNTSAFFFCDGSFNSPLNNSKELLEEIIRKKIKIQFCTCLTPHKNSFDDEFFKLYKRAGGIMAMLGCETFSASMLTSYNKLFTIDDLSDWIKLAEKNKLRYIVELLFGGYGENKDTVIESIDYAVKLRYSLFRYSIGIRILPKTGLYKQAVNEGLIRNDDDILFPRFYVS